MRGPFPFSVGTVLLCVMQGTAAAQAPPLAWESFVDGSLPGIDEAHALVVAPDNSVYVTGASANIAPQGTMTTVRYGSNGVQHWIDHPYGPSQSAQNKGAAIALDPNGYVYVAGTIANNSGDFALIKYNASGRLWKKNYEQYDQADVPDEGNAIAVDANGNVYLVGTITSTAGMGDDQYIIKTDSAGEQLWSEDFAVSSIDEHGTCVAISANGNIYVGGDWWNLDGGGGVDMSVARYAGNGTPMWNKGSEAPQVFDRVFGIATTTTNGVLICGTVQGPVDMDMAVVARDENGSELWSELHDGSGTGNDEAVAVKELASGMVVVVGHTLDLVNGQLRHAITTRLLNAGSLVWSQIHTGPEGLGAWPTSIAVDANDNILIAGYSTAAGGLTTDALVVKYNPAGAMDWAIPYAGAAGFNDRFNAIALNSVGDILVCGTTYTSASESKYVTVQYGNAVGVEEVVLVAPTVFPNPASNAFTIQGIKPGAAVTVFNALGQQVLTSTVRTIDVGDWTPGLYFVRVGDATEARTTRFTITR